MKTRIISALLSVLITLTATAATKTKEWKDIDYVGDSIAGHRMDIYVPDDGLPTHKVIILIYGSAWFSNNPKNDAYKSLGKTLNDGGFAVVSINHRASTEAKFPSQINDVKAALRYVRGNAAKYGLDTSFIGITGYSSGGHLSSLAGTTNGVKTARFGGIEVDIEGNLGNFTKENSNVDAVVDWFGPIDMSRMERCETFKDGNSPEAVLIGGPSADNPDMVRAMNPMSYIDSNDPMFLVIHGDADPVVPYCQSEYFAKALKEKGRLKDFITVSGGNHGPVTFNKDTFRRMVNFFRRQALSVTTPQISSPDGKVQWKENSDSFTITYTEGNRISDVLNIPTIGMLTKDGGGKGIELYDRTAPQPLKDTYRMPGGKCSICSNEANEVIYNYVDNIGRTMKLQVRVYNDGVAFRYILDNLQHTHATEELTTYIIPEGTKRWMQKWTEPYEEFFPPATTGESKNKRWGYPALIQTSNNVYALITEAGIERQNSASSLFNDRRKDEYRIVMDENRQNSTGQWISPWRVIIVGNLQNVVTSTLVTDVSAPNRIGDVSWIKPGSVSWIYWAYNHGSNDYQIVKKYVDMAVEMKWPYVLIDAEWDEMKNGGNVEDAIRYAIEKGVKPLLWYNSSTAWIKAWGAPGPHNRLNAPENREREFAWLEQMGVAGVKIDFFAGDKQETMEYCIDLLECAARHQLMVNFHGATIPRGWQRTYPNLMSVEAVYGAEWYNNNATLTQKAAAHNATLPFTRNVIGPMDYTPCTFSDSQHPHITSNAHELALPVIFESPLLHWADKPESYLIQPEPVKKFMSSIPTVWDETRLLSGYPGESVVMARRNGTTWYIAGINGKDEPQTLTFDISFLPKGRYTIFADGKPWSIKTAKGHIPNKIRCKERGGFVIIANN